MASDLTLSTRVANFCAERCASGPVVSIELRKWASMKLRVDSKVTTPQSPISHEAGALATLWAVRGPDHDRPRGPHLVEKKPTPTLESARGFPRVPEGKDRCMRLVNSESRKPERGARSKEAQIV